ncbi:MAG: DUF1801 domain-containing protein [Parvularculaceae bacterium]
MPTKAKAAPNSAKTAPVRKTAPAKASAKKSDLKTKPRAASVEAFIDAVPNETRRKDARTLLSMMKRITGEKATLWGPSIIGFGSYHYKYDSGREGDMCAAGFSPRAASLVVYIVPGFSNYERHLARLGKHRHGGSCLYINKLDDVDLGVLEKIIADAYAHMKANYPR